MMTVFFGQYIEKCPLFTFVKCRLLDLTYSSPLRHTSETAKPSFQNKIHKHKYGEKTNLLAIQQRLQLLKNLQQDAHDTSVEAFIQRS